jgi:GWxTD domain-containing protein
MAFAQKPAPKGDDDFFKKWLEQDATYIIAKDELAAARRLRTPEEQDAFIQSFWERRDPTPGTLANEYRDEHYRRVAHANERFTTSTDGWRTDRGKMYIRFGEPDNIERNASAGATTMRSGQSRITVPFEIWEYRNIPGIGPVKLTFVDKTMTGHYELSINPADKIAKFNNEDAAALNSDPNNLLTTTETPDSNVWSKRIDTYVAVMRPPEIRFKDLKGLVNVRLTYNLLNFNVRLDTLRGPGDKSVVPMTFEFDSSSLSFQESSQGRRAQVNVYGVVTDLSGRVAYEFEDAVSLNNANYFQRFVVLDPGRYKVTAIAKDLGSGNTGSREQVLTVSRPLKKLSTSSLILSDILVPAAPAETVLDNFVISRYKVRPLVKPEISRTTSLGIYQEIYAFEIDSQTNRPQMTALLQVFRKGQSAAVLNSPVSAEDLATRYIDRLLFAKVLQVSDLEPGEYIVRLSLTDNIRKETVVSEAPLLLKD